VVEKVKLDEKVAKNDEPEKRLEETEKVELAEEKTKNDEQEKGLKKIERVELAGVANEDGQENGLEEEECFETEDKRRGKESLMEWIDRQLEEAERKTGGSPWPEIPEEDELEIAGGDEVCLDNGAAVEPDQEVGRDLSEVKRELQEAEKQIQGPELQLEEAERKTGGSPWPEIPEEDESEFAGGDDGAAVDPDQSSDDSREVGRDLSDVKRELQEAEKQLLGAELQLEEAEKCASSQGNEYEQSRENKRTAENTQAAGTSDSLSADYPQQPLDVILEGALNQESNNDNEKEEKSIDEPSSTKDNNYQFDMSSDCEIELLKEPSKGCEDNNETGQLLDETESEGENTEDVTLDVNLKNDDSEPAKMESDTVKADNTVKGENTVKAENTAKGENTEDITLDVNLKNEDSEPAKMGSNAVSDTPDELIVLRPAWQKNLSSKN